MIVYKQLNKGILKALEAALSRSLTLKSAAINANNLQLEEKTSLRSKALYKLLINVLYFKSLAHVTDIFRSVYVTSDANIQGNVNSFDHYTGARGFKINLRYRFNKGDKFERKERAVQLDEIKRAGGN